MVHFSTFFNPKSVLGWKQVQFQFYVGVWLEVKNCFFGHQQKKLCENKLSCLIECLKNELRNENKAY